MRGRPSALTGSVVKDQWQWSKESAAIVGAIIKVLSLGAYKREAAMHAGISESTLRNWTNKGAEERRHQAKGGRPRKRLRAYFELLLLIEKAMADAQLSDLGIITRAAHDGAWQAAAWKLERRRDMFIPKVKQEIEATVDAKVEIGDARERVLAKLASLAERSKKKKSS